jgi:hypothetical protein
MGKRELLLIGAFVSLGVIVYYTTAPAAAPSQQGFSISKIVDHIRREVRGNRASAEVTTTSTIPLRPGVTELRFETGGSPVTVTGEDRADVSCELKVWSSGFDEAEAKRYAEETELKTTDAGSTLILGLKYPDPATQRASLVVKVPKSLTLRLQATRGKVEIDGVDSVDLVEARGQATVRNVSRRVNATHRGGTLTIESVAALKLNTRGSNVSVTDVKAEAVLQVQAGEFKGEKFGGTVDLESNGTRVAMTNLWTAGLVKVNAVGGRVMLGQLGGETRVDARDTRLEIEIARPAPIVIYSDGEEPADVTLPAKGYRLEALAINGRLNIPDDFPAIKTSDNEQRVSGNINGGGPAITLRTSRGTLTLKESPKEEVGSSKF